MSVDLDGRKFTLVSNTAGDAKPGETIFVFEQRGTALRATYAGGPVVLGAMIGKFVEEDEVDLLFQQATTDGRTIAGKARMRLDRGNDGKLNFIDDWVVTHGGTGSGRAIWREL